MDGLRINEMNDSLVPKDNAIGIASMHAIVGWNVTNDIN